MILFAGLSTKFHELSRATWPKFAHDPPHVPPDTPEQLNRIKAYYSKSSQLKELTQPGAPICRLSLAKEVLGVEDIRGPDIMAGGLLDDWDHKPPYWVMMG